MSYDDNGYLGDEIKLYQKEIKSKYKEYFNLAYVLLQPEMDFSLI